MTNHLLFILHGSVDFESIGNKLGIAVPPTHLMEDNQASPLAKISTAIRSLWGGSNASPASSAASSVEQGVPVMKVKREKSVMSGESAEDGERPTKKSRRARVACVPCSKLKQRCDDSRPCSRCVKKGKEAECVDFQALKGNQQEKKPVLRTDFSDIMIDFIVKRLTPQLIHDLIMYRPFQR
jgi:hypothetical protein